MSEDTRLLEQIRDELREIRFWSKLSGLPALRRALRDNLRDNVDKLVYELSDGIKSTRQIAKELRRKNVKVSHVTIANMWRRWAFVGLVEPSPRYRGRYGRVIPLNALGIEIPASEER